MAKVDWGMVVLRSGSRKPRAHAQARLGSLRLGLQQNEIRVFTGVSKRSFIGGPDRCRLESSMTCLDAADMLLTFAKTISEVGSTPSKIARPQSTHSLATLPCQTPSK